MASQDVAAELEALRKLLKEKDETIASLQKYVVLIRQLSLFLT